MYPPYPRSEAKPRLALFDVLKGIAIFMVLMGHVLTMCIRGIDAAGVFKVIGEVHMPLFFFISGWFTYKKAENGMPRPVDLRRRALQLLLPMVAVSSLWIYWFPYTGVESPMDSTWHGLWFDTWKNGYWFTPVLFEIMLVYNVLRLIPLMRRGLLPALVSVLVLWFVLVVAVSFVPTDICSFLSLELVSKYFPVFGVGAVAAMHKEEFLQFCCRPWVLACALIASGFLIRYVAWYWLFPHTGWTAQSLRPLLHIALAISAIGVFRSWTESETPAVRLWSYVGRRSLGVYLWHYFFLFPLGAIRPMLESTALGIVPLLTVSAAVAALIMCCALAVDYILGRSKVLAFVFLGEK